MHQTNRRGRLTILCLAGLMALPASLVAQVAGGAPAGAAAQAEQALLRAIPNDATAFVAIRSLRELDRDIQAISAQVGFPLGPEGMFPAPLAWLRASLGLTEGLREEGGAALVLLNARGVQSIDELPDRLVIYLPATNPQALLASLGGQEGPDGLYRVNLGGAPSVATTREGFALIAKLPDAPDQKPEALMAAARAQDEGVIAAMAPDRVKAYGKQDLFIWINFRTIPPEVRQQLLEGVGGLLATLGGGFGAAPAGDGQDETLQQIDRFLGQGEEASVALQVDSKIGLVLSGYSRVKPDSQLARQIAATKSPEGSLLAGLPQEDFIFAGGAVIGATPEQLQQLRQTAQGLAKRVADMDTDPGTPLTVENLQPLIDLAVELIQRTQRVAGGISKLSDAEGQDSVLGLTAVFKVQEAAAWRADLRKGFERVKEMAAGVARADGVEQAQIDEIMNAIVWQENAAEVAGASVDVMRVDLESIKAVDPENLGQIKAVAGPEGILLRVATVGDNTVVIAFGGGEQRLERAVGLARENQAPLANDPKMRKIANRLPEQNRIREAYFSLDNLLSAVDAIGVRVQSPLPVRLTLANAAPIAFAMTNVDDQAQQMDLLIPIELVVSVSEMVRQQLLPMLMMGGMGGGGQQDFDEPEEDVEPAPSRRE